MSTTLLTDREAWLSARRRGVGASEAGAILGLSPFKTPLQVYFDKLGMMPEDERPRLKWGLRFEDVIAEAYTEETGRQVVKPERLLVHKQWPWMLASLDRQAIDGDRRPVELKRPSVYSAKFYGPPGSDEVPRDYYLQVQQQMACSDTEVADLAALFGADDFRIFTIRRDDAVITKLAEAEREFMDRVERQDPPLPDFEHPTTAQLLAMIEPDEGKSIALPEELVAQVDLYESLGKEIDGLKKQREATQSKLVHAMGTAEKAIVADGRSLTRKIVTRAGYNVDPTEFVMFRVNHPRSRK